jgi:hypothetical protein
MKQLLFVFVFISVITSCSIERRHYLPGYHVEWQVASGEWRVASGEWRVANGEWRVANEVNGGDFEAEVFLTSEGGDELVLPQLNELSFTTNSSTCTKATLSKPAISTSHSPLATRHSPLAIRHSPLSPDTLKKPYKPQQQYRQVDPVGKASVLLVVAAVAIQKVAGLLTWFEVVMPLSFGPGIFIPALAVAVIGLGLSAYSAYRVRKNPEKYKKNEWGKAALAILGWQILMSALFAWFLGGLPVG